jgi:hypothetical protein
LPVTLDRVGTSIILPPFPLEKIQYYKRITGRFDPREGLDALRKI